MDIFLSLLGLVWHTWISNNPLWSLHFMSTLVVSMLLNFSPKFVLSFGGCTYSSLIFGVANMWTFIFKPCSFAFGRNTSSIFGHCFFHYFWFTCFISESSDNKDLRLLFLSLTLDVYCYLDAPFDLLCSHCFYPVELSFTWTSWHVFFLGCHVLLFTCKIQIHWWSKGRAYTKEKYVLCIWSPC